MYDLFKGSRYFLGICFLLMGLGLAGQVSAAQPVAGIFDTNGKLVRSLKNIPSGASVAVADLGQDGIPEIIVGSVAGAKPTVRLLRLDGSIIRQFPLGNVIGTPSVHIAVGDVTGDGVADIVTSFGKGTTPEVRVYTTRGERQAAFLAFGKGFRGGVALAVGDVDGDGVTDIITGAGAGGGPYVLAFNAGGEKILQFLAYPKNVRTGVQVVTGYVNHDNQVDIVTTTSQKGSLVKIFSPQGNVNSTFSASVRGSASVRVVATAPDNIVLGSGAGQVAQVASYAFDGTTGTILFKPFGKNYTDGVTAQTLNADNDPETEVLVVPATTVPANGAKRIVIDISEQRLYRYEGNVLIATHRVSTGKWSMPTPLGDHKVKNKLTVAYSRKYGLYMDNWMAVTPDGAYGIHSLPYWRLKNGGVYYEGVNHLGQRVSHGCVRLSPPEAKQVFAWAQIGMSVQVVD